MGASVVCKEQCSVSNSKDTYTEICIVEVVYMHVWVCLSSLTFTMVVNGCFCWPVVYVEGNTMSAVDKRVLFVITWKYNIAVMSVIM